jgi:hypothetical protein
MTLQSTTSVYKSTTSILRLALVSTLVAAAPLLALANDAGHDHDVSAKLVQIVRANTMQFINANNLKGTGYAPAFGCVTGSDHGAMGIHYINGALVDGTIDERYPQALIYEPVGNKRQLLGVEYITDAATWLAAHDNTPPQLEGQAFQLVGSPNRFGLNPFFELHVWAWRENPQGAFVDWNNNVTCEKQQ